MNRCHLFYLRHTKTSGTLIFEDGGSDGNYVLQSMPGASFGAIVDWSAATRVDKRSYSIEAIGNESMFIHLCFKKKIKIGI